MEADTPRIISHRGNLNGPKSCVENHPDSIQAALDAGFDVEIDVHWHNNQFWLGHDLPQYPVTSKYLDDRRFWCHAKDVRALALLRNSRRICFAHDSDPYTLTSHGDIWFFAGEQFPGDLAILVMPETSGPRLGLNCRDWSYLAGICTDFPLHYQELIRASRFNDAVQREGLPPKVLANYQQPDAR